MKNHPVLAVPKGPLVVPKDHPVDPKGPLVVPKDHPVDQAGHLGGPADHPVDPEGHPAKKRSGPLPITNGLQSGF